MNDVLSGKNKNTMRMLYMGLGILIICIAICTYMVITINEAYAISARNNFNAHHDSEGHIVDSKINQIIQLAKSAATQIENSPAYNDDQQIPVILNIYDSSAELSRLLFVSKSGMIYMNGKCMPVEEYEFFNVVEDKWNYDMTANQVDVDWITIHPEANLSINLLCVMVPVFHNGKTWGNLVATVDMTNFFDGEEFVYIKSIGSCYLVDNNEKVVAYSKEGTLLTDPNMTMSEIVRTHVGATDVVKHNESLSTDESSGETIRYEEIKTSKGFSFNLASVSLKSAPNLYFVCCYKDNLIEDEIFPLVIGSVLSCVIIIFLMVIIIVYVWATAKKANMTIEKLAFVDAVTGGKNINYFKEFAMTTMGVLKETPFVIYRFDIANFRYINEAYGHVRADGVLKAVIEAFDGIFSEKELCVRMNADQFLALLVNDKSIDTKVPQFRKKVNENARGLGIKYPIRFKTGIYQVRKHDRDIDVMIDHANVARKTLRGEEKDDVYAFYSEKIIADMRKIDRIESEQQRALATEEFKVFYQPKWDIVNNRIAGAEALVRWIRNDGSMVFPDEFIPVFENNGFVEKLDFYMLEKVCAQMRELMDQGKPVVPVSVNQSRLLLHSTGYVQNVADIIAKNRIPEGYIELEITETVFEDEREVMIKIMNELKTCGVKLSMDDFGSGYSSLNMLKDVPFDIIKIDREFFSESVTSEASLWILQKIIEMADGLGMEVICEGVETAEQVAILRQIGCVRVQGYFFSKPISSEDYIERYCKNA